MMAPMTPLEFKFLARSVKDCTGISLGDNKAELLQSRLNRLLKEYQLPSVSALCNALSRSDGESLKWRLAESVAVQETYFFRDKGTFECFGEQLLPALLQARETTRRLRIWCAACSTGQEPYSVAMMLAERADLLKGWEVDILATDFSEEALLAARSGVFSQFQVQRGLPVTLLVKYFKRKSDGWEIVPEIRDRVCFRQQNLMHNSMRHGIFDIVFCRNVLIYFDEATKRQVLSRLSQQILPGGYLVLGATESVLGLNDGFGPLEQPCPGVFRLLPPEERQAQFFGRTDRSGSILPAGDIMAFPMLAATARG
ncbi:MAG: CheR family methyltransferase [Methyloligella sp. ZOD6]